MQEPLVPSLDMVMPYWDVIGSIFQVNLKATADSWFICHKRYDYGLSSIVYLQFISQKLDDVIS